jgi:dienelactone hydrolase
VLVALIGVVVGALVVVGCIPPPPPPPAAVGPMTIGVTHPVRTAQYRFVDVSRFTAPYGDYPGAPWRVLSTTVWYPSDGGGPYPLVVFAHGYGVTPSYYGQLLSQIAAAGYVVAAPTYPLLSGQPAGPTDTVGWNDLFPDTWFVTDQVLARSASGDPAIGGLIDPSRIAVAGHSDGAAIAFGDGYVPFHLDSRVRAVVSLSADQGQYGGYQPNGRPVLYMLSDQDIYNPWGEAIAWARDVLQDPKTVVSLVNASHEGPYVDPGDPHFDLAVRLIIGFLDATTKSHPEALDSVIADAVARPDLAHVGY